MEREIKRRETCVTFKSTLQSEQDREVFPSMVFICVFTWFESSGDFSNIISYFSCKKESVIKEKMERKTLMNWPNRIH